MTYGKRYSLAALLAIAAEEDDDGEAATAPSRQAAKPVARPVPKPAPIKAAKPGSIPKECPKCGGKVWDNREKKASGDFKETSPDWSCSDKECKDGKYRTGGWVSEEVATVTGMLQGHGDDVPPHDDSDFWEES